MKDILLIESKNNLLEGLMKKSKDIENNLIFKMLLNELKNSNGEKKNKKERKITIVINNNN